MDGSRSTFQDISSRWLAASAGSVEPKTVDHYRWVLENYVLPGIGDKDPSEITEQNVRELVEEKRAQGLSANTVYVLPKMIARILSFASAEGLCEAPQWNLGKGRPVRMNPNVILSQAQVQKLSTYLIENSSPRHLGIYLLLTTGMSVGELLELTWADVSFPLRRIRVLMEAETTPDSRNRYRQIPINEQQRIYLKRIASLPTVYVASGKPEPVSRYALRSSFFLALHELNLPEMPLSDLCRTFAVQSRENGMGYADLSKALGQNNSTSFRAIYRKLVTGGTRERLDREFDASKKVRQAPETKRPPEKDPEIRELEAKVDARKQQLKETLANLEGDLEIIHALRNSDLPAPGAPPGRPLSICGEGPRRRPQRPDANRIPPQQHAGRVDALPQGRHRPNHPRPRRTRVLEADRAPGRDLRRGRL